MSDSARTTKDDLVALTRDWFKKNGEGCNAIIGISGGRDSSVCAALCVEALGADRVIGVLTPNLKQSNIDDSYQLIDHLGIRGYTIPIAIAVAGIHNQLEHAGIKVSEQAIMNLPPRIRMSVLHAIAQSMNGRVIGACNLSESWVGYSTCYGNSDADFSLLKNLTAQEIKAIGKQLALPPDLVEKNPGGWFES